MDLYIVNKAKIGGIKPPENRGRGAARGRNGGDYVKRKKERKVGACYEMEKSLNGEDLNSGVEWFMHV